MWWTASPVGSFSVHWLAKVMFGRRVSCEKKTKNRDTGWSKVQNGAVLQTKVNSATFYFTFAYRNFSNSERKSEITPSLSVYTVGFTADPHDRFRERHVFLFV